MLRDPVLDEVMAEENERRAAREDAKTPVANTAPSTSQPKATNVGVRGITGSLTSFEVEQAMSAHHAELLACVKKRPPSLGQVAGEIAFHIDVDGSGGVERVRVMQSEIGYLPLEECLATVVAAAPFPVPAGRQHAETQWRMSVDPLRRPAEPLDSAELEDTIAHQSEKTYEDCEVAKARRFAVTGYLTRGKLHPLSVRLPWRGPKRAEEASPEQLTCLANALEHWKQWPKARGQAKVSFELRWVKAPPPTRRSSRARRHR